MAESHDSKKHGNPLVQLADVCNTEWRQEQRSRSPRRQRCNLLMFVIPNGGDNPFNASELYGVQLADVCNTEWRQRWKLQDLKLFSVQLADVCNTEWRAERVEHHRIPLPCNLLMFVIPNGGSTRESYSNAFVLCNLLMFVIPNGGPHPCGTASPAPCATC